MAAANIGKLFADMDPFHFKHMALCLDRPLKTSKKMMKMLSKSIAINWKMVLLFVGWLYFSHKCDGLFTL
jgi:hypothetical protein